MSEKKVLYKTTAYNTGGRNGESHLADGSYSVTITSPKELGGSGNGQNPEQLFALGFSACFNSALELVLKKEGIRDQSRVQATVDLLADPSDNGFKLSVELEVAIQNQPITKVQELANIAHTICPYSKATHGNIDVTVDVVTY